MNKNQKQVIGVQLNNEKKVLSELKKTYQTAQKDIESKIDMLLIRAQRDEENLQSIIYQVNYQKALKKQISGILDVMNANQFTTISEYLTKSYEDGFIGTLYDLQGQGIPLIFPIDQKQVAKALVHDTKLSKSLYAKLGEDVDELKKRIQSELSRGISQNYTSAQIAKNIENQTTIGYNKASRIARTEGHRISQEATFDAQKKAKDAGADIVKQWDSTLDGRTRSAHRTLDGQIRELDDPFEVNGFTAMYPGGFGIPSQDIHCRCVVLQRARWAVEEDGFEEHTKWDGENGVVVNLSDEETYKSFKEKYKKTIELAKTAEIKAATWTMNPDGTFTKGIVKHEAQYKLDIDDDKVLTIDVDETIDIYGIDFLKKDDKYVTFLDQAPDDVIDTFWNENLPGKTNKESFFTALKKHGYSGFKVGSKTGQIESYLEVLDDSLVTKTKKSKFETLSASLATAQKKLNKIDNKSYSGIWKDETVSVSDYAAYKSKIQSKRDFYKIKIELMKGEIDKFPHLANSFNPLINQFNKYLDDLDEFEKLGQEYEAAISKVEKIKNDLKKFTPKNINVNGGFSNDAYSQARKDNALWFTNKNGSTVEADKHYRDKSGEVWRDATDFERDSIYDYTQSYHKINEPLRGIEYGTNKYLGVGNVDLDTIGVKYGGFKRGEVRKQIDAMTDIIDRSYYYEDIWLQRGCNYGGMDKFFGISPNDFYLSEKELSAKLLGTTPTEYGFMSTAVSKGKGFSSCPIILNVYAPKGTKMMYVEPFSAFGAGDGRYWDGISKQSIFGKEAEMLLQRETKFRVTKVEKSGSTWYIDIEVIGQRGN